jgi:hypothetical protein
METIAPIALAILGGNAGTLRIGPTAFDGDVGITSVPPFDMVALPKNFQI